METQTSDFLARLGHELRNPLNAIATAVEVLNRVDATAAVAARAREVIAQQTRRLAQMTDRLLFVSRLIADDVPLLRQPVELAALTRSAFTAARLQPSAERLQFEAQLDDAWVHADAQCVTEILEQLLDNAIRYTPDGGTIDVQLRALGGHAHLTVQNDGPGVDPALLPRLFEPFVRGARGLGRDTGGLGLGLTLVKRLVELHGGAVGVRAAAGGTIFEVTLPLRIVA